MTQIGIKAGLAIALGLGALGVAGCQLQEPEFEKSMKLGGVRVSPETLQEGWEAYMLYCYACHGEKGDGKGPAAKGLRPPPRNFKQAIFKFAGVQTGKLPSDADLDRIIHYGLNGTAMLPWDIPERERRAIIQYIKTFGPDPDPKKAKDKSYKPPKSAWATKTQEPVFTPATPDPFGASRAKEAIALGKMVYHVKAQCQGCHPSYLTTAEYGNAVQDAFKAGLIDESLSKVLRIDPREDPYSPQGKDSAEFKVRLLPPDFALNPVRSVRVSCPGAAHGLCDDEQRIGDFYRIIANGIPGAAMPPWSSLPADQLWSLAHYVKWLHDKSLPGGDATEFRQMLLSQPPYVPPAPPPAPEPTPAPEAVPAPAPTPP